MTAPAFHEDIYGADAQSATFAAYKRIRDLGPAVWLAKRKLWAIARFADVRAALRADGVLVSGRGVAANDVVNTRTMPITLTSDGETHLRRRQVLIRPLMPAPLKELRTKLEGDADALVTQLANGASFDAVARFASHLPVTVVADLVGLDDKGRENMLRWAAATFDALGAMNGRGIAAMPALLDLSAYVQKLDRARVKPGGWADRLFDASDRGELSGQEARAMIIDYVGPALDTTILATAEMVRLLAVTPGAYQAVREEPTLIPGVINEAVRHASPIRSFTRLARDDYEVDGALIPKGARVAILYASANHDERHYAEPETFDVRRNPRDHVGWGHGAHTCVGMHLARLEMEVLLGALVRHVSRISIGEVSYIQNNLLRGPKTLAANFHPH